MIEGVFENVSECVFEGGGAACKAYLAQTIGSKTADRDGYGIDRAWFVLHVLERQKVVRHAQSCVVRM
jgi:hypothetical protein